MRQAGLYDLYEVEATTVEVQGSSYKAPHGAAYYADDCGWPIFFARRGSTWRVYDYKARVIGSGRNLDLAAASVRHLAD